MLYYIIYYYTYIANDIVLYMRPALAHMQHSAAINRPTSCKSSRAYIYTYSCLLHVFDCTRANRLFIRLYNNNNNNNAMILL